MPTDCISYSETNYFTPLILDYLAQKEEIKPFYNRYPHLENFQEQMEEKAENYNSAIRKDLVKLLNVQYQHIDIPQKTAENIKLLENKKTFTVITGHQLNLFTGPLYFLFKIISTINLTKQLKQKYTDKNFIPVYWMATEDHDFDEISFFNLHGKKFKWTNAEKRAGKTAVGKLSTKGLEEVFQLFSAEIGGGENAEYLKELFKKSYLEHQNLTDATRYIATELFKESGLVILDADHPDLKKYFIPNVQNELKNHVSFKQTSASSEKLEELGYKVQVSPRALNLFYLNEEIRERIIEKEGRYFIHETEISFSREEIEQELENYPERFSPNVIMRPLYQEVLLPNLCYIGGGGELAYWLELKAYFESENVTFPMLLLRNSALLQTSKHNEKREKLHISLNELFLKQYEIINRKVRKISDIDIDFSPQKEHLVSQFQGLYELAEKTDKSFLGAVKAQEVKQLKGLENLEKRLLKAQKRKLSEEVGRISRLQNELFPNGSHQERQTNFSEFYKQYGKELLTMLSQNLNPLEQNFKILTFGKK